MGQMRILDGFNSDPIILTQNDKEKQTNPSLAHSPCECQTPQVLDWDQTLAAVYPSGKTPSAHT